MILVDSSVWIGHFRRTNAQLVALLHDGRVLCHRFVLGELALGNLRNRTVILEHLSALPTAVVAEHEEVLTLVEGRRLAGTGIGWIDAHLLASAMLSHARIWTLDAALAAQGRRLGVGATA